jgi:hypothetical protein
MKKLLPLFILLFSFAGFSQLSENFGAAGLGMQIKN